MANEISFKQALPQSNVEEVGLGHASHASIGNGSLGSIQFVDAESFFEVGFDSPPTPSMRAATPTHFQFASFDSLSEDAFTGNHTSLFSSTMRHNSSQSNHISNEWAVFPSELDNTGLDAGWAAFPSDSSGFDAPTVQAQEGIGVSYHNDGDATIDWGSSGNAIDTLLDNDPFDDSQSSDRPSSHGASSVSDQYVWAATIHGLHYNERVFGPLNDADFVAFVNAFSGKSSSNIPSTEINFTARAPGFEDGRDALSFSDDVEAFSVKNNSVEDLVSEWYDYFASQSTEGETPYKIFNFNQSAAADLPQELVDAFQRGETVKWVVNDSGDLVVGFGQTQNGGELKHSLLATHVVGMESWLPQERYDFVMNKPQANGIYLRDRPAFAAGELNLKLTQEASGHQLGWLGYDNGSGHFQPDASAMWDGLVRTKINDFAKNALLPKLALANNIDKIHVGLNLDTLK